MLRMYIFLATLTVVALAPALALAALLDWRGMRRRLGLFSTDGVPTGGVWFHAASMGEATAMAAAVRGFSSRHPDIPVIVSTMTVTGWTRSRELIPYAALHTLLPLDIPVFMRRFIRCTRPRALVLVEGELWPGLVDTARRSGVPIALISARMSDRSYPRNRYIRPLLCAMLSRMAFTGAQTPKDAERLIAFGSAPERTVVTGNVKYDYPVGTDPEPKRIRREDIGLSREHTVIVAGCPRPEEEERAVLHACCEALRRHDHVRIIWAPRHLDRLPDVETMLRSAGLSFIRRARIEGSSPVSVPVILLDTLGELAAIYALADIAFVGATLVPLGGHNVMEPALFGVPVVFGPHTANVAAAAAALLETGGGVEVRDGYDLAKTWLRLIEEPERRRRMGQAASQAARTQDGALERTLDLIDRWVLDAGT